MKATTNRKDRRELEVILRKRKSDILNSLNADTLKLWEEAEKNLQWVVGDPIKTSCGFEVDFSHFDLIIATAKFTPEDKKSDLLMLQRFWITIYPYVDNVIRNLNHYKAKFRELYDIEEVTLYKYAIQNLELQCRKEFMKKYPELEEKFIVYHKEFKEESDKKIAEMKEKEEKRLANRLEREEKKKSRSKLQAFADKLGM